MERIMYLELFALGFLIAYLALQGDTEAASGLAKVGVYGALGLAGVEVVGWLAQRLGNRLQSRWGTQAETEADG